MLLEYVGASDDSVDEGAGSSCTVTVPPAARSSSAVISESGRTRSIRFRPGSPRTWCAAIARRTCASTPDVVRNRRGRAFGAQLYFAGLRKMRRAAVP
jgi:hypothetical protein